MLIHLQRLLTIQPYKPHLVLSSCVCGALLLVMALIFMVLPANAQYNNHVGNVDHRNKGIGLSESSGPKALSLSGQKRNTLKETLRKVRPEAVHCLIDDQKNNGMVEGFDLQHQLLFRAGFKKYALHGSWQGFYANGSRLEEGSFRQGLPDGLWRHWYMSGQLRSLRSFDASKWQAMNSEVNRGNAKTIFHTGTIPGGSTPQNFNILGTQNARFSHPVKGDYQYPFSQALAHGLAMNFYPNGQSADSGYYKNGLKEGLWEQWFENGQLSSRGAYHLGHKHGSWKYYSPQGKLDSLKIYHFGLRQFGKHYQNNKPH